MARARAQSAGRRWAAVPQVLAAGPGGWGNMALGTRAPRRLLHLPAGSCLLLLLVLLLLLCGQLGGGQKKKEVETFASFAIAPR